MFKLLYFINYYNLNVSAGTFGVRLVGPFFLQSNLTVNTYLELLQGLINPVLTDI